MNRYLVIDLIQNVIISTHDLTTITEDKFDRYGSSISCIDKNDLINELKNIIKEMESE